MEDKEESTNLMAVLMQKANKTNREASESARNIIREFFKEPYEEVVKEKDGKQVKQKVLKEEVKETLKEVMKLEMLKWVKLYSVEYGFELPFNIEEMDAYINEEKSQLDCRGSEKGITVYNNGEGEFLKAKKAFLPAMNIKQGENGQIYATLQNQPRGLSTETQDKNSSSLVDSQRDQLDYFAELFYGDHDYLDMAFDVLPHEAMHAYIVGGGVIGEGTTELLSRKAVDKYGGKITPTSHAKETEIVREVMDKLGLDFVGSVALTNDQRRRKVIAKELEGLKEKRSKLEEYKDRGGYNLEECERQIQEQVDRILGLSKFEDLDLDSQEPERELTEKDIDALLRSRKLNVEEINKESYIEYERVIGTEKFRNINDAFKDVYKEFLGRKVDFDWYRGDYDERIVERYEDRVRSKDEDHQILDQDAQSKENREDASPISRVIGIITGNIQNEPNRQAQKDRPEKILQIQEIIDEEKELLGKIRERLQEKEESKTTDLDDNSKTNGDSSSRSHEDDDGDMER